MIMTNFLASYTAISVPSWAKWAIEPESRRLILPFSQRTRQKQKQNGYLKIGSGLKFFCDLRATPQNLFNFLLLPIVQSPREGKFPPGEEHFLPVQPNFAPR
jgi:hypothetical protein